LLWSRTELLAPIYGWGTEGFGTAKVISGKDSPHVSTDALLPPIPWYGV